MDFKKIRKTFIYSLGRIALTVCLNLVKIIPFKFLFTFANVMGTLGFYIASKQRKIALESLNFAFSKEKSKKEIVNIAKNCFISMAKSGVEIAIYMNNKQLISEKVRFVNKERLDNALAKGKGVILVSAHFGNFPLMIGRLSQAGYKVGAIMRPMKDAKVEEMFESERRKMGIKAIYSIPRNTCVNNTIQSLRNNEIVFLPLDQNFGTGGVFVNFFGKKAATATGPVIFAQRTDAVLLPVFIVRQKDNTHEIVFDVPLELLKGNDENDAIVKNVQQITDIIELYVRKYPGEWGWIHKRWKAQEKR